MSVRYCNDTTTFSRFTLILVETLIQAHNFLLFQTKMDTFVVAHLIGWWAKTIILRDIWLSNVISVLFEVYEYTLEHQLPNFHECWWDHVSLTIIHVGCIDFSKN